MHLTIENMGPIAAFSADLGAEWAVIRGQSRIGKTTIAGALSLLFWGKGRDGKPFPVDLIRDGSSAASVEALFPSGTRLRRSITRKREARFYRNDIELRAAEWPEAIGAAAEEPLAATVITPLAWIDLASGPGGGRPLRDLLIAAAGVDPNEALAGLKPNEPRDEKGAAAARAAARAARDEAKGARAEADAAVDALPVHKPDPDTDAADQALVAAAAEWARYDQAADAHVAGVEREAAHAEALAGWRRDVEALGVRPAADSAPVPEALVAARAAREAASADVAKAREALAEAERIPAPPLPVLRRPTAEDAALVKARAAYAAQVKILRDLPSATSDVCPTCQRGGYTKAAEARGDAERRLAELKDEGDAAATAKTAAQDSAAAEHAAAMTAYNQASADRAAKIAALRGTLAAATETLERAAKAADAAADLAPDPGVAWDARSRLIGAEPKAPPAAPPEPAPPATERPAAEAVKAAAARLEASRLAAGVAAASSAARATAQRRAQGAAEAVAAAEARLERAEEVLKIVRDAPTSLASKVHQALGDTGSAAVAFTDAGGVEVTVNGRPWRAASRGELAVADLQLRAAIRRAAGLDFLPLIVDNAQDWSGEWPNVPGPVWLMMTEPGELTVEIL